MMRPERFQPGLRGAMRSASLALFFFATAGMLIWGKLRLVGDVPRSAWAVPEPAAPTDEPAVTLEREAVADSVEAVGESEAEGF